LDVELNQLKGAVACEKLVRALQPALFRQRVATRKLAALLKD
jgi:hypothetical protein